MIVILFVPIKVLGRLVNYDLYESTQNISDIAGVGMHTYSELQKLKLHDTTSRGLLYKHTIINKSPLLCMTSNHVIVHMATNSEIN